MLVPNLRLSLNLWFRRHQAPPSRARTSAFAYSHCSPAVWPALTGGRAGSPNVRDRDAAAGARRPAAVESSVVTAVARPSTGSTAPEVAFGMASRAAIQAAVDRLTARGVTAIVAVPLFVSSHSSVITSTEYLLGLRPDAPADLKIFAKMDHASHGAPVSPRDHAAHAPAADPGVAGHHARAGPHDAGASIATRSSPRSWPTAPARSARRRPMRP